MKKPLAQRTQSSRSIIVLPKNQNHWLLLEDTICKPFDPAAAVIVVIVTAATGYVFGFIGAAIWNKLPSSAVVAKHAVVLHARNARFFASNAEHDGVLGSW